mmetsp:Transcript_45229/g.142299  ORF Transcript_45229/g.142299 Transcript_45229/m.142299 type:complete len:285 (-) Transcript_45229:164-1018(-)
MHAQAVRLAANAHARVVRINDLRVQRLGAAGRSGCRCCLGGGPALMEGGRAVGGAGAAARAGATARERSARASEIARPAGAARASLLARPRVARCLGRQPSQHAGLEFPPGRRARARLRARRHEEITSPEGPGAQLQFTCTWLQPTCTWLGVASSLVLAARRGRGWGPWLSVAVVGDATAHLYATHRRRDGGGLGPLEPAQLACRPAALPSGRREPCPRDYVERGLGGAGVAVRRERRRFWPPRGPGGRRFARRRLVVIFAAPRRQRRGRAKRLVGRAATRRRG